MKIISKFKDYYDFVAGYDTDPRKVYVRHSKNFDMFSKDEDEQYYKFLTTHLVGSHDKNDEGNYFRGSVWFCDDYIPYLQDVEHNEFYYEFNKIPDHIKDFYIELRKKQYNGRKTWNRYGLDDSSSLEVHFGIGMTAWNKEKLDNKKRDKINTKTGIPVLASMIGSAIDIPIYVANPRLSDIKFGMAREPSRAFTEVYNFIPYHEPDMPSDPTDMGRFENKGFDKKSSFRHPVNKPKKRI